jgi:hypothetical protein
VSIVVRQSWRYVLDVYQRSFAPCYLVDRFERADVGYPERDRSE